MVDWQNLVRERLWNLTLKSHEKREVVEELAAHLEESYERFLTAGAPEDDAVGGALAEVEDWSGLARKIRAARSGEGTMTNRVTQLWLPGLLMFALSAGIFAMFEILGAKPWTVATNDHRHLLEFHLLWLLSLPLVGAMGAYLSWRAGGSRSLMRLSIIFPVLPLFASILVWLPVSLVFNYFIARNSALMYGLVALVGFVLTPGVALLAGGLPAQLYFSRKLASRDTASN